jgi:hypothetical protein
LDFFLRRKQMGRPLKIQKLGTAQGVTYPTSTSSNQPAAAVPVDLGFPNFDSLQVPVVNQNPSTLTGTQFLGVVGGASGATSATFPRVKVRVFITGFAEEDGYILRQKGSHKYLVAGTTDRTALISGRAYRITTVGDTAWNSVGVVGTPVVGTVFTATAALANTGTGRVNAVGVCVLTSDLSPTAGLMSISYFNTDDSVEVAISKLTNKWLLNWANFANAAGTALDSYADTGNNAGVVNYTGEGQYVANFFTDEGTVTKSGSNLTGTTITPNGTAELAIVENYTS